MTTITICIKFTFFAFVKICKEAVFNLIHELDASHIITRERDFAYCRNSKVTASPPSGRFDATALPPIILIDSLTIASPKP